MRRTAGEVPTTNLFSTAAVRPRASGATGPVPGAPVTGGLPAGGYGATERTAEIPVVRASGTRSPVELADGTVWYPGVSRRLPAPFLVRLGVWLLFFLLLLGLAGLAVERYHPGWLSFLRYTAASGPTIDGGGSPTGTGGSAGAGQGSAATGNGTGSGLRLVSSGATSSTYAVPASSYKVVLTLTHATWVRIASPAGSTHYVVAQTYQGSASPLTVPLQGSSDVYLGAATTSLAVVVNGRTVGAVQAPAVGHDYRFVPS